MARRNVGSIPAGDKAKVRVFFAEVEGNNESVQEALKTMVSAMNRPVRVISDPQANGKPAILLPQNDVEELEEAAMGQEEEVLSVDEEVASQNSRKARGTGKKVDRNAGLTLVPDLNFRPSGQLAFKEFVDEKGPKSDVETTLVAVYYMHHTMSVPKIGPSHIMTAFKEAGKPIPVDLKQTIRNIKKTKMWLNFDDIEDIRMTTQGNNFVEHEMQKGG